MSDVVTTWLSKDGELRLRIARTSALTREAVTRHQAAAYAEVALGRALNVAALIPMTWKDADRVSIQFSGVGPLGTVMVEMRKGGTLRGYVSNPQAEAPRPFRRHPRPHTVGWDARGHLVITRQVATGTHAQSDVHLFDGSIDGDVAHWFDHSEQVPTRLRVDEHDGEVVGVLVQALPGPEGQSARREGLSDLDAVPRFVGRTDEELMDVLCPGARKLDEVTLRFGCPCSRERSAAGVAMLDEDELLAMMMEDQGAEVRCEFCAEVYAFTAQDLASIIDLKRAVQTSTEGGDA